MLASRSTFHVSALTFVLSLVAFAGSLGRNDDLRTGAALVILLSGMVMCTHQAILEVKRCNRPADVAWTEGHEAGYDKGWQEGHRATSLTVVDMSARKQASG